ncbi:MAG TPA: pilus assembly PilX N-terminal domain-containing protein [Vicinamibacteria bacterium]|nr:pilus assembly PilX N-terminal domain-containing protein [Vicinamibacteria bacterium]
MKDIQRRLRTEEGSAFVISILVLFVLSVLGLALMLTTTTEKDISINFRWGEQAFFNADAALEYGKNVLAAYAVVNTDFASVLPPPRGPGLATVADNEQPWGQAHPEPGACNPSTAGCRDYQYHYDQCPTTGACTRIYIGRVLRRPDGTLALWDFRAPAGTPGDLDNDGVVDIEGTFTLWVRRPTAGTGDYDGNDRVILTAEGTAPNAGGLGSRPTSLRRLEMSIRLPSSGVEGTAYSDSSKGSDSGVAKTNYGG